MWGSRLLYWALYVINVGVIGFADILKLSLSVDMLLNMHAQN